MSFICHIHNYTEYNQQWNVFSAFNPSKCTHPEQWAADTAAPGEQLGVQCLAQASHLSRGQFLLEPIFETTTSGYKADALSISATTAPTYSEVEYVLGNHQNKVFPDTKRQCSNTLVTGSWRSWFTYSTI